MNLSALFGGSAQVSVSQTEVKPAEVQQRQNAGAILIDVREPAEWRAGHAPNARHIPLGQLTRHLPKLPTDKEILFICQSGHRSGMATSLARQAGLTNARNVRGGMDNWMRAGLPLSR